MLFTVKKMTNQVIDWEKIFVKHIYYKGVIARIYKGLLPLPLYHKKKKQMGKRFAQFSEGDIQMVKGQEKMFNIIHHWKNAN